MTASAKGASGWLSAKSRWRSIVSACRRPDSSDGREALDDAGGEQLLGEHERVPLEASLVLGLVVVVGEQPRRVGDRVALAGEDVDEHRVRDAQAGLERLGLGDDEPLEGLLGPVDEAVGGLLALDLLLLLGVVARLLDGAEVLDDVVRCLRDDPAAGVEPRPSGAADDLVELAGLEQALLRAVELRQAGEQHGADRDVDADAERVGAADDLEQAVLRELLDEAPVLRQHARVVHADAVPHEPRERAAEARPRSGSCRCARRSPRAPRAS